MGHTNVGFTHLPRDHISTGDTDTSKSGTTPPTTPHFYGRRTRANPGPDTSHETTFLRKTDTSQSGTRSNRKARRPWRKPLPYTSTTVPSTWNEDTCHYRHQTVREPNPRHISPLPFAPLPGRQQWQFGRYSCKTENCTGGLGQFEITWECTGRVTGHVSYTPKFKLVLWNRHT